MRKVMFKRWIPREIERLEDKRYDTIKPGTACWSDFLYEGWFHQWGAATLESEQGYGNYSVALVELFDGTIEEVLPTNIKFLPPDIKAVP